MNKNVRIIEVIQGLDEDSAYAKRLYEIRTIIKDLQAEEKQLKQRFLSMDVSSFDSGDYLVSIINKERQDLDKKSLAEELGDKIKSFMKKTSYKTVNVSKK